MKNAIREYLELSDDEKRKLLNSATIVFDTNVLLSLYRYSKETREALLGIMKKYKERLWIPHQVATEFMKNRTNVIYTVLELYEKQKNAGDTFVNECIKNLNLDKDDKGFQELREKIKDVINKKIEENVIVSSHSEDVILQKILILFNGNVGKPYSKDKMGDIEKEGKERYEADIPPGYKDAGKADEKNINNAYGDLIIWHQILDYAKESKKSIVFVSDDKKEDWWNTVKGKKIGPRIELRKEFYDITKQEFHMYQMNQFITVFSNDNGKTIDKKVVEEIKEVSEKPIVEFVKQQELEYRLEKLYILQEKLKGLTTKRNELRNIVHTYEELMTLDKTNLEIRKNYQQLVPELIQVNKEIENMNEEIQLQKEAIRKLQELEDILRKYSKPDHYLH